MPKNTQRTSATEIGNTSNNSSIGQEEEIENTLTGKLKPSRLDEQRIVTNQLLAKSPEVPTPTSRPQRPLRLKEAAKVRDIQEQCRQLYLSLFYKDQTSVQSLGITSSVSGEGKTFFSIATARVLSNDTNDAVLLVDCNWEHPSLHEHFRLPATPGLAEWVRGECRETDIRHQVSHNLTVIPAGNGQRDAVKLLQMMRQKGLREALVHTNEKLLVDLPPIASNAYGPMAAALVESLILVVRARVTPDTLVTKTCEQLKGLPLHSIVLNQVESRIPRWIRQIL